MSRESNVWFHPFTQLLQWTGLSSTSPPTWQGPEVARPPWWPTLLMQPAHKTISMQGFKRCRKRLHAPSVMHDASSVFQWHTFRLGVLIFILSTGKEFMWEWLRTIVDIKHCWYCRDFNFHWSHCLRVFRTRLFKCSALFVSVTPWA